MKSRLLVLLILVSAVSFLLGRLTQPARPIRPHTDLLRLADRYDMWSEKLSHQKMNSPDDANDLVASKIFGVVADDIRSTLDGSNQTRLSGQ
jgi:hypothetical protein